MNGFSTIKGSDEQAANPFLRHPPNGKFEVCSPPSWDIEKYLQNHVVLD